MKQIIVDGEEHIVILEDGNDDGGLVINHMAPKPGVPGVVSNFRAWYAASVRPAALLDFDLIDAEVLRKMAAFMREPAPALKEVIYAEIAAAREAKRPSKDA